MDDYVQGKCMQMCPEDEIKMRESQKLLHVLEMETGTEKTRKPKADKEKIVKSFSRSAAGKFMQDPKHLRPPDVLLKTVNYLLDDVILNDSQPFNVIYDFIMDRLRSVRQDMVIQNLSKPHSICILQPIVRFYAYSAYRFCTEDVRKFDPYINNTHLQECLKRLLSLYDECEILFKDQDQHEFLENSRPQFEALYVVFNLGDANAITRALTLKSQWRTDLVEDCIKLSLNFLRKNYIRCYRIIEKFPALLAAMASLHLPNMRRMCYKIMCVAYNSKLLYFPTAKLKTLFLYDNEEQVEEDCKHYGIQVDANGINFQRNFFKENASVAQKRKHKFVEEKLRSLSIPHLLLS